jgi:Leucine-rich repeat (LRR) protein
MKKRMFFTMLCLFAIIAIIGCSGSAPKQLTDQEILVKIYETMNGPEWEGSRGKNWLSDKPIGEWENVITNDSGRVISLRIQGGGVRGLIPAEIGGLTELEQLYINSREFDIPNVIPSEIGKLTKLKILALNASTDATHGRPEFPNISTLTNLKTLYISGFDGKIPENFSELKKLQILSIDGFEGKIPESICQLTALEELTLNTHHPPKGEVPACIGKLNKLKTLVIDYSGGFIGEITQADAKFPEWIWDMTNLEHVNVRAICNTGGPIPGDKVARMNNLKSLTILNCGLTGPIPAELFASGNLSSLTLSQNAFTGSIPAEVGNCSKLSTFRLDKNQLTGNIPDELAKCEKLFLFDLSGNQLSPNIPAALKAHPKFSSFKF